MDLVMGFRTLQLWMHHSFQYGKLLITQYWDLFHFPLNGFVPCEMAFFHSVSQDWESEIP